MAKRKLTKQQRHRVQTQQKKRKPSATQEIAIDESTLSPPIKGQVITRYGTQADIEPTPNPSGLAPRRCHIRANLDDLVCGDHVIWQQDQQDSGVVVAIEGRSTLLSRPDSRGLSKSMAANISQMVIVIAPYPEAYHNIVDRFLVAANHFDIKPCIVVNKTDLINEEKHQDLISMLQIYKQLGYPVVEVSAEQQTQLEPLQNQLKNHTSIFVGQSGVGKSSLINSLLPHVQTAVGEVSQATGKGKHTTTAATLFHFPFGGDLIDSPGLREFSLWQIPDHALEASFPELRQLSEQCQFRNCSHLNEPGCAVQMGLQDGRIERARFESFLRIKESMVEAPKRD